MKEKNKSIIIKILILVVAIIIVISIGSYAYWQLTKKQQNRNIVGTACLNITFSNESGDISLNNAYPISDSDADELTPYSFTITNDCMTDVNYMVTLESISLDNLDSTSYLNYDYLRVRLDNDTPNSYGLLESVTDDTNTSYTIRDTKEIAHHTLAGGQTVTHSLRLWIDENTPLKNSDGTYNTGKHFLGKVKIIAGQNIEGDGEEPTEIVETPIPTDESCFEFDASTGTITYYRYSDSGCPVDEIVIPSHINGTPVTTIGERAFYYINSDEVETLSSVYIPYTVTTIANSEYSGVGAFAYNSNLKKVVIEDTQAHPSQLTTIGAKAFANDQLTNINIPSGVTTIGNNAFSNNELTNVNIPSGVTTIGNSAFTGNQLTNVNISNGVTTIGSGAFSNNELTNVEIPDGVTTIGGRAFYNNQLRSITIPLSVTKIENYAFSNNDFLIASDITIESDETNVDTRFDKGWTSKGFPDKTLEKYGCYAIKPSSPQTIVKYDFTCGSDVIIPSEIDGTTITIIGDGAFAHLNLTSVIIPSTITRIDANAFQNNYLVELVIPNSVTLIKDGAFANNRLTQVQISSNINKIGTSTQGTGPFENNRLIGPVVIPSSITTIYSSKTFKGNPNLSTIVIKRENSDGITLIDGWNGDAEVIYDPNYGE